MYAKMGFGRDVEQRNVSLLVVLAKLHMQLRHLEALEDEDLLLFLWHSHKSKLWAV